MKNRNHTILFWLFQALVLMAFFLNDTANVRLNSITEFHARGNAALWEMTSRVTLFAWTAGWALLVAGSVSGAGRGWYASSRDKRKYMALAVLFAPLTVLTVAVLFQPI